MILTEQQKNVFDKFKKLKVGALFMKQGTGKTRVALELIKITECEIVLFIVPHSLIKNLENEIEKWGINKEYIIETYQGIAMSNNRYMKLLENLKNKKAMIVADESTFIKNEDSKTFNRVLKIRDLSEYRLILNGTPLTKNEWDLYNQMEFLSPKILKMTRNEFLKIFFTHIKYKKRGEKAKEFYKFSEVNIEYLQALISPYTFYCNLKFDKEETTENILIEGGVDTEYENLKSNLLNSLKNGEDSIIRQLRIIEKLIFTDKIRLNEIANYLTGQCIVFCNFIDEIEYLENKIDCYVIQGKTKNRNVIIEKFKNDNKPLLIMLGIGAYGHNLQFCNRVMFSSICFDYGKIEQALYRIKRLGQEKDIEYTYFDSNYKFYDMIKENLEKKEDLKRLVINKFKSEVNINECI